jgi:serine/threonine protein kinase
MSTELTLPLPAGTVLDGRYRILGTIGVGGSGVVHEAEHAITGQRVAVRVMLDAEHGPRLEREARALGRLRSPHVVRVIDLGRLEGRPYLVLQRLEGPTLREVLDVHQRLPLRVVASLGLQLCEALDEAHEAELLHRDIKPENVRLSHPSNRSLLDSPSSTDELTHATLFDFGIVKPLSTSTDPALTTVRASLGTPVYMSPEQLRASSDLDPRADVYALATTLYECLAGMRPRDAESLGDLVAALRTTPPKPIASIAPETPPTIADVLDRSLRADRADRPANVRSIAEALAPYADPTRSAWLARPARPTAPAAAGPSPGPVPEPMVPSSMGPFPLVPAPPNPIGSGAPARAGFADDLTRTLALPPSSANSPGSSPGRNPTPTQLLAFDPSLMPVPSDATPPAQPPSAVVDGSNLTSRLDLTERLDLAEPSGLDAPAGLDSQAGTSSLPGVGTHVPGHEPKRGSAAPWLATAPNAFLESHAPERRNVPPSVRLERALRQGLAAFVRASAAVQFGLVIVASAIGGALFVFAFAAVFL